MLIPSGCFRLIILCRCLIFYVSNNHLINDLGFFINKNGEAKLVVLAEEQSYWSPNITYRLLGYLVDTLNRYLRDTRQSVHKRQKVYLPEIELYVIYVGDEEAPDTASFNDDFYNGSSPVDIKVNIIKKSGTDTIISQYIGFCKIFRAVRLNWLRYNIPAPKDIAILSSARY